MPLDPAAKENLQKAVALATSKSPTDHEQLFGLLNSKPFLFSIQPEQSYNDLPPKRLQIARVIKTLMDSPHAIARESIVRLLKAQDFLSLEQLDDLLIIALVAVRPLPPVAVGYLDQRSDSQSAALHLVMEVLAANESEPALQLFERKIASPNQEIECRIIWLRAEYLIRRNDVPILRSYKRMIVDGTVPPEMRHAALESLCAYDPAWYRACSKPKPPLRVLASAEAKAILREILVHAKNNMDPFPGLKTAVETTHIEIGDR